MKKYRIEYNPYIREMKLWEHYDGDSVEWGIIGGENAPELRQLIAENKTIQEVGLELLNCINAHNKERNSSRDYSIEFIGTKEDYDDLFAISAKYCNITNSTEYKGLVHSDVYDDPLVIMKELEKSYETICKLYKRDSSPELNKKLESCLRIDDPGLTVLVYGLQNSGKSTLINALLNKKILPASDKVETASLFEVSFAKGKNYVVTIESLDGNESVVTFEDNKPFKYKSKTDWIRRVLDNQKDKEKGELSCVVEDRVYKLLKELNASSRKFQDENKSVAILKTRVEIPSSDIKNNNIRIIDCPGSNAIYLGDEHKLLIARAVKEAVHAVSMYVMLYKGMNWETTDSVLEDVKAIDANRDEGENGQIDFERSIYVISSTDGPETTPSFDEWIERNPKFKEKRIVPVSALSYIEIGTRGMEDISYRFNFVSETDDRALYLEREAVYPSAYDKEKIWQEYLSNNGDTNEARVKLRTGIPIVQFFLQDYAERFSNVYRVECYFNALQSAIVVLKQDLQDKVDELANLKENAEKTKKRIRKGLKEECDALLKSQSVYLDKRVTIEPKKEDVSYKEIEKGIEDKLSKESAKIMTETEAFIKSLIDQKKEENKVEIIKDVIEFSKLILLDPKLRDEISKGIERKVNEGVSKSISNIVNVSIKEKEKQLGKYKKLLRLTISEGKPEEVSEEELKKIYDTIDEWQGIAINPDDFKIEDNSFKLTGFDIKELFNYIFDAEEWTKNKVSELFYIYWSKKITTPVRDKTVEKVKADCNALTEATKEELDTFAPMLIKEQQKIDEAAKKLDTSNNRLEQANAICTGSTEIVKRGKVNV